MPKQATTPKPILPPEAIRRVLRTEMTAFFRNLCKPESRWPGVSHQDFVEALADSLIEASVERGVSQSAYLQTLVHELQDRVNTITKG